MTRHPAQKYNFNQYSLLNCQIFREIHKTLKESSGEIHSYHRNLVRLSSQIVFFLPFRIKHFLQDILSNFLKVVEAMALYFVTKRITSKTQINTIQLLV